MNSNFLTDEQMITFEKQLQVVMRKARCEDTMEELEGVLRSFGPSNKALLEHNFSLTPAACHPSQNLNAVLQKICDLNIAEFDYVMRPNIEKNDCPLSWALSFKDVLSYRLFSKISSHFELSISAKSVIKASIENLELPLSTTPELRLIALVDFFKSLMNEKMIAHNDLKMFKSKEIQKKIAFYCESLGHAVKERHFNKQFISLIIQNPDQNNTSDFTLEVEKQEKQEKEAKIKQDLLFISQFPAQLVIELERHCISMNLQSANGERLRSKKI